MESVKNYVEILVNTVAKTLVEAFENLTIEDVNMYLLGYNQGIEEFENKLQQRCDDKINSMWGNECNKPVSWSHAYAEFKNDIEEVSNKLKEEK